jgi:hypothetical protein
MVGGILHFQALSVQALSVQALSVQALSVQHLPLDKFSFSTLGLTLVTLLQLLVVIL